MPRPGGNPDITNYSFKPKHDWGEPCTAPMGLKVPASMKQAIKEGKLPNWQEICRRAIAKELGWDVPESNEEEEKE